jgi:hypothetical protein
VRRADYPVDTYGRLDAAHNQPAVNAGPNNLGPLIKQAIDTLTTRQKETDTSPPRVLGVPRP